MINKILTEEKAKIFIQSPYFQSAGIILILFSISSLFLYFQYNQIQTMVDLSRSQVNVIENEYKRFMSNKQTHEAFVKDVSNELLENTLKIGNFETLYINSLINDITKMSHSSAFLGDEVGSISFSVIQIKNRLDALKNIFKLIDTKKEKVKILWHKKIIQAVAKVASQKSATFKGLKEQGGKVTSVEYLSIDKLDLMLQALTFSGLHAKIDNIDLENTCNTILFNYQAANKKWGGKYYYKKIIKVAFEYLVLKGSLTPKEVDNLYQKGVFRNIFGESITDLQQKNLVDMLNTVYTFGSLNERVDYYNEWFVKSRRLNIEKPVINLTPISLSQYSSQSMK